MPLLKIPTEYNATVEECRIGAASLGTKEAAALLISNAGMHALTVG